MTQKHKGGVIYLIEQLTDKVYEAGDSQASSQVQVL